MLIFGQAATFSFPLLPSFGLCTEPTLTFLHVMHFLKLSNSKALAGLEPWISSGSDRYNSSASCQEVQGQATDHCHLLLVLFC